MKLEVSRLRIRTSSKMVNKTFSRLPDNTGWIYAFVVGCCCLSLISEKA